MTGHLTPVPDDLELFRQAVGAVKRLRCNRAEHSPAGPAPIPRSTLADEHQALKDMVSEGFEPWEPETGEELIYCREGLQHSVLRKLRRGQFRVGTALDLHGMNVAAAHQALIGFLKTAQRDNTTCVRIIHGKGNRSRHKGPVLKHKVNHWLRQRDEVLAFCSARPVDGGTGAVYVLLRRRH